jgi:hypothetical protein
VERGRGRGEEENEDFELLSKFLQNHIKKKDKI